MRLSLVAACFATSVAVLAGCSGTSQGTVPATDASQSAAQHVGGGGELQMLPKVMSREQASKLHPSVLPRQVLEKALRRHHPSRIKVDKSAKPSMVITDDAGYIWWISKKGVISGYATDCAGAEGGVVDRKGRLIVACTGGGTINIYNKGNVTGPANVVLNDTSGFFAADAFEDKSGNIYATNLYGLTCGTSTCSSSSGDFVWWTTANQSMGSSPSGSYADPNLFEDYFADIDANGNITVDGFHCTYQTSYGCASAVPEVDMIMPMGSMWMAMNDNVTLNFPGGINVLAKGQISVLDQGCYGCGNSALYLYNSLPGTPASTLTPPQNLTNTCDPISTGYNKDDSHVLIGDAGCRAGDLGKVSSNTWKSITNIDFQIPIGGAFLMSGQHRGHR